MHIPVNYQKREHLQTLQLSNLLHHLTNTISGALKKNQNTLYYDIRNSVSRDIVADYESLKKTLEEIMVFFSDHCVNGEIICTLKREDDLLKFTILYTSVVINNTKTTIFPKFSHGSVYPDIGFSETDSGGLKCTFTIPYYEVENEAHYTNALQGILQDKRALFVGKNRNELKIIHYIFKVYGMEIDFITPDEFKEKKPDLNVYDIVLLRSVDMTPLQISVFQKIDQKEQNLKIIMMHDIFVTREERMKTKSIAYAEIFRPAIIGDVEEILRKIYIDNVMINEACCNESMQKIQTFIVSENSLFDKLAFEKFKGRTILVVDSSPIQLSIVKNILSIDGLSILTAKNGKEALAVLEGNDVDLIFSEINLAELDGCSLAKKLKKESAYEHIPVIAVSSFSFDYELMKMIEHGITAHIPVPFKKDHFYNALHRYLLKGI